MKKIITVFLVFVCITQTFGALNIEVPPLTANEITIPIGNTGKSISLEELSTISIKNFEQLTDKKMGLADKMMFKNAQRKIRNSINNDGTLNNKKIEKIYKKSSDTVNGGGFNIGGFALGFLLGLIGILISYIINNENNASRHKWAWIGFGVWIAIVLIASV